MFRITTSTGIDHQATDAEMVFLNELIDIDGESEVVISREPLTNSSGRRIGETIEITEDAWLDLIEALDYWVYRCETTHVFDATGLAHADRDVEESVHRFICEGYGWDGMTGNDYKTARAVAIEMADSDEDKGDEINTAIRAALEDN